MDFVILLCCLFFPIKIKRKLFHPSSLYTWPRKVIGHWDYLVNMKSSKIQVPCFDFFMLRNWIFSTSINRKISISTNLDFHSRWFNQIDWNDPSNCIPTIPMFLANKNFYLLKTSKPIHLQIDSTVHFDLLIWCTQWSMMNVCLHLKMGKMFIFSNFWNEKQNYSREDSVAMMKRFSIHHHHDHM